MFVNPVYENVALANVQICHPKYLGAREIQAILANDSPIFDLLDEPIQKIIKIDGGYLVVTASYEVQVDVNYLPPEGGLIGGSRFELHFHEPKPSPIDLQMIHPKYEVAREIRDILSDCRLFELLGNEVIQSIHRTETGYDIVTNASVIKVDVNYLPPTPGIIGEPSRYELVFHDPS